jgi:hypothetical protein
MGCRVAALEAVDVRKLEMPYTPHRIWLAIHEAREKPDHD